MEWRPIIALARYGGLRTPSETFALTWHHVNLEQQRITVPSAKTEHHAGHASRVIPILPELRQYLDAAWHLADDGNDVPVITVYRDAKQNLRTQFERIIRKAGLTAWPKLFPNLRSSRETELAERFPLQVVVAWLGNSEPVAKKHYLQVTEDHFEKALNEKPTGGKIGESKCRLRPAQAGKLNRAKSLKTRFRLRLLTLAWICFCVQWAAQAQNKSP